MRKYKELTDPLSCLNKAKDGEMVFVLLGRDGCAPETIRDWCKRRIEFGENKSDDPQIMQALKDASTMEMEFKDIYHENVSQ